MILTLSSVYWKATLVICGRVCLGKAVHDGEQFVHEPLRMAAAVAAPIEAINRIIAKHESLRNLVDHGWMYLFAMGEASAPLQRYRGALQWESAA